MLSLLCTLSPAASSPHLLRVLLGHHELSPSRVPCCLDGGSFGDNPNRVMNINNLLCRLISFEYCFTSIVAQQGTTTAIDSCEPPPSPYPLSPPLELANSRYIGWSSRQHQSSFVKRGDGDAWRRRYATLVGLGFSSSKPSIQVS
ncbi:hypothetical protein RIF29_38141 [Crotalaria pallida]|uniref:Uncharacterized protein n=1 Tax=Crotalaria pallida TaxID=3830 RepID=A0AAN9HS29_CROPI